MYHTTTSTHSLPLDIEHYVQRRARVQPFQGLESPNLKTCLIDFLAVIWEVPVISRLILFI
jgi:hypothetical protein